MTDEEQFILELLPVIKKYLTNRGIKEINEHIDKLEQLINGSNLVSENLNQFFNEKDADSDADSDDDIEEFQITFEDLSQEVQENICVQLGYDHVSDITDIMGTEPIAKFYLPRN